MSTYCGSGGEWNHRGIVCVRICLTLSSSFSTSTKSASIAPASPRARDQTQYTGMWGRHTISSHGTTAEVVLVEHEKSLRAASSSSHMPGGHRVHASPKALYDQVIFKSLAVTPCPTPRLGAYRPYRLTFSVSVLLGDVADDQGCVAHDLPPIRIHTSTTQLFPCIASDHLLMLVQQRRQPSSSYTQCRRGMYVQVIVPAPLPAGSWSRT